MIERMTPDGASIMRKILLLAFVLFTSTLILPSPHRPTGALETNGWRCGPGGGDVDLHRIGRRRPCGWKSASGVSCVGPAVAAGLRVNGPASNRWFDDLARGSKSRRRETSRKMLSPVRGGTKVPYPADYRRGRLSRPAALYWARLLGDGPGHRTMRRIRKSCFT